MASNLGQNFISNTDWMIKRDIVNMKYEINQLRKDFNEAIKVNNPEKKNESSSMTMINTIKSVEVESNGHLKSSTPLSLDAIRQSNLQNRDSYYRSTNTTINQSQSMSPPSLSVPNDEITVESSPSSPAFDSSKNITLTTGASIPAVRLDKTNILILGPTG